MVNSQGLRIKQLILVGYRKNYVIPFYPGVNIIYGDADTGKSSILRVIHYLLGRKQIKLDHELIASVKYAVLEIAINGDNYCIQRDLYNSSRDIEVFSCLFADIADNFPKYYASTLSKSKGELKSLSEFLLETLNFPAVSLKQSPSKDDSDSARLSILDLFKFIYLDQDDVGSAHMLNIGNFVVEVKNREVLKYVFNVLDSNITDLESEIAEKTKEQKRLDSEYKVISGFLNDTKFSSIDNIDTEISSIEEESELLNKHYDDIDKRLIADSKLYEGFKEALNSITTNIASYEQKKFEALQNIERFSRLENDYKNDIAKLKSTMKAREIIGRQTSEIAVCPLCTSEVSLDHLCEEFSLPKGEKVKQELTSISRRVKDLAQAIDNNRHKVNEYSSTLSDLYEDKEKAKLFIDEELAKSISPYLTERDAIVTELAVLTERRSKFQHALKVRNQQKSIAEQIGRLEAQIVSLKDRLDTLNKEAPSIDDILKSLGKNLNKYLTKVNIKNRFGVSIDPKTFLPVVRGTEYRHINSGGLRTIVSIGYLTAILEAKLHLDTNLPGLLMIDTVGKFLGKTKEEYKSQTNTNDDVQEGVSDPEKYKNIYEYLIELAERFEDQGKLCQIILVDNDIPPEMASRHKGFTVSHYSTNGLNDLPIGLIDDWDKHNNSSF